MQSVSKRATFGHQFVEMKAVGHDQGGGVLAELTSTVGSNGQLTGTPPGYFDANTGPPMAELIRDIDYSWERRTNLETNCGLAGTVCFC